MANLSMYQDTPGIKIASPFEIQAGVQAIQNGRNQNRLSQLQFKEAERVDSERNRLADLTRQHGNSPEYANRLMEGGFVKQAQDYSKYQSEQAKATREAEKAKIEAGLQQFSAIGQIMSGVRDQNSYDAAKQQVVQILGPEAAANMPPAYDPQVLEQGRVKAMSVKDQMEQRLKEMTFTTPTASALLQAETSRRGQDIGAISAEAGRALTMRGQDMTDTRARDLNATKVEANAITREAKAETANLTKQSQLASFDTMIGTLDRLSTHKGLANATGMMNYLPDRKGSDVSNFKAELESFKSQAFIPMVSQLKGMGALSDAEGKKLTAAVGALDTDVMSESAVRESITRIIADMKAAKARVQGVQQQPAKQAAPKGKTVKRTGTVNGRKVIEYSDGSVAFAK